MRILVMNGGTGTVKAALVEATGERGVSQARVTVEIQGDADPGKPFAEALARLGENRKRVQAIGHRVVHGGRRFSSPTHLSADVEAEIERLVPLAPLHNPVSLAGIRLARAEFPEKPMVAVFDTAFHARRNPASMRYALPPELTESLGLYRYGFHGIAHASLVEGVARIEGAPEEKITAVTLQLGHGCSACAVRRGLSVETSMGFTPLGGLMMATRSGDVDPGLVLHLLKSGRGTAEIEALLSHKSGLLGMAGTADMREALRAEAEGDARAAAALELYVRRIVETVGAYLTLLDGQGALVFGGGVGENAPEIRRRVAEGLRSWGIELDHSLNADGRAGRISREKSRAVYLVPTDEETLIARSVARLLEDAR